MPDAVWKATVPGHVLAKNVCLPCFVRLADDRGIPWDQDIEFFPLSLATRLRLLNEGRPN